MSDKITIKELLDLDQKWFVGQVIEHLEATIELVLKPREVKGQKGSFWSQFLVIKDKTGKIGLDFTANSEDNMIPASAKGKAILVEAAKGTTYPDKNKETQRKLSRGRITVNKVQEESKTDSNNGYETLTDGRTVVSREVWEKKDRTITRIALAKSLIEAGRKWNKICQAEADGWFGWIMDNKEPEAKEAIEPKETKETSERAALRKTWQGLNKKLADKEYWTVRYGTSTEDQGYRLWLDDEFQVASSTFLTDKQMQEGIKIMAGWWNEKMAEKKEE